MSDHGSTTRTPARAVAVFYALFGLTLAALLIAAFIGNSTLGRYQLSVEKNNALARQIAELSDLSQLTSQIAAPGDDVFQSVDVVKERDRLLEARRQLEQRLRQIRDSVVDPQKPHAASHLQALREIEPLAYGLAEEVGQVFDSVAAERWAEAGARMAAMNRNEAAIRTGIIGRARQLRLDQQAEAVAQMASVQRLEVTRYLTASALLVLVLGIVWTGRRLRAHAVQQLATLKTSTERLKRQQDEQRRVLDALPALVFYKDTAHHVVWCNQAAAAALGCSVLEIQGLSSDELRQRPAGEMFAGDDEVIQSGQPKSDLTHWVDAVGEERWMRTEKHPYRNEHGETGGVVIFAVDITNRRRTEAALRASEERHRSLIETARDVVFALSPTGALESTNPAFEQLTGWRSADWIGKSYLDLLHPDDVPKSVGRFRQLMAGQPVPPSEMRFHTAAGSYTTGEVSVTAIRQGEAVTGVLGIARDITARLEAERQLRTSQFAMDHSGESIFLLNRTARFIYVNNTACRRLGHTRDELLTMSVSDIAPEPGYQPSAWPHFWEQLRVRGHVRVESSHRAKSGEVYPVEVSVNMFQADGDDLACAFVRDISEGRRAQAVLAESEQRLRTSEARYRVLVEHNPLMFFTLTDDGAIESINARGAIQLGYAVADLVGQPITKVFPIEHHAAVRAQVARCFAESATVHQWENTKVKKDGTPIWVHETAIALRTDGLKPLLLVMCEDISATREQQLRLHGHRSALIDLSRNQAILAGDLKAAHQAVTEAAATAVRVGRASLWFYDASRTELVLHDLFEAPASVHSKGAILHAAEFPSYFAALESERHAVIANDAHTDRRTAEFSASYLTPQNIGAMLDVPVRSRGQVVGVLCLEHIGAIREWTDDEATFAGSLAATVSLAIDIAARVGVERELRAAQDDLERRVKERTSDLAEANALLRAEVAEREKAEQQFRQAQKMEAVGQLAGGVAHDFNNILMVIAGHGGMLVDRLPASDRTHRHAVEIVKAGERASSLTRQLLAFSRQQVLHDEVIDLNLIVGGLNEMLLRLIGAGIEFATYTEPDPVWISADAALVEQVIVNLVVNARDAMPNGGRLEIRTTNVLTTTTRVCASGTLLPGAYAVVSVSDTGVGMVSDVMARMFEPFFTTKEPGKGTGLGLAMVHGTVTQSGGVIDVESRPGAGTTVLLYYPATVARQPADAGLVVTPSVRGTETVLLAEDEPAVRDLLAEMLRLNGYHVLEGANGVHALEMAAEYHGAIDLLVTDLVMPKMGGRELASQMRLTRPGIRVLFMSGYSEDWATNGGPDLVLQKPFAPSVLLARIRVKLRDEPA